MQGNTGNIYIVFWEVLILIVSTIELKEVSLISDVTKSPDNALLRSLRAVHYCVEGQNECQKSDILKKCDFVYDCPVYQKAKGLLKGIQGDPGVTGVKGYPCKQETCKSTYNTNMPPKPKNCAESCQNLDLGLYTNKGVKGEPGSKFPTTKEEARHLVEEAMKHIDLDDLFDDRKINLPEYGRILRQQRKVRLKRSLVEPQRPSNRKLDEETSIKFPVQNAIVLDDIRSLQTFGMNMPLGTIVISYLQNDANAQLHDQSDMGMFIKTNRVENQWSQMPVELKNEIAYEIPPDFNHSGFHPRSKMFKSSDPSKFRLILAMLPFPLNGGTLSGLHHADRLCHKAAHNRLGIPGFRALLPDSSTSLEQIIPWHLRAIPIVNLAGQTLFRTWRDFLFGLPSTISEPIYRLDGIPENALSEKWRFWLGGDERYSCNWWNSTDSSLWGLVWTTDPVRRLTKTTYSRCSDENHLFCYKLVPGPGS